MKRFHKIGKGIYIHPAVKIGQNVSIGHCSCIGYGNPNDGEIIIGNNVTIGAFCVVHFGTTINDSVEIDHYCTLGINSKRLTASALRSPFPSPFKLGSDCMSSNDSNTPLSDNIAFSYYT